MIATLLLLGVMEFCNFSYQLGEWHEKTQGFIFDDS